MEKVEIYTIDMTGRKDYTLKHFIALSQAEAYIMGWRDAHPVGAFHLTIKLNGKEI